MPPDLRLTAQDIAYLEEPYMPHRIVGAIDRSPPQGVMLRHYLSVRSRIHAQELFLSAITLFRLIASSSTRRCFDSQHLTRRPHSRRL